jgi:hypothetical protein
MAYSMKNSILYGIGTFDSNSDEVDVPLLVQHHCKHGISENLEQVKRDFLCFGAGRFCFDI